MLADRVRDGIHNMLTVLPRMVGQRDPKAPPTGKNWRGGEIGRHSRLEIGRLRRACGFESHPLHQPTRGAGGVPAPPFSKVTGEVPRCNLGRLRRLLPSSVPDCGRATVTPDRKNDPLATL